MADSHRAGGAAMARGQRFQAQVTAWWCARMLLQTPVGQRYDLPPVSTPERIYCETTDSVDDLRVEFSGNGRVYGQCKRSLTLSNNIESEWASVLKQFYNELQRVPPIEVERRFVLFYENPNNHLRTLDAVLRRYRGLPAGMSLVDAASNQQERNLANSLNILLDSLQENPELSNFASSREELLRRSYIQQLRLGVDEEEYLSVADTLQHGLLINPAQVNHVLISLHRLADDLLADRGSIDRSALRQRLLDEGVALRESVNYRLDFERLDVLSATEIASHEAEGRSRLTVARDQVCISRLVVQEMFKAIQESSFLVVGGAGTGKTGCLLALAKQLRSSGCRVWYWAAQSLPYPSPQEIGTHLQLQHPWSGLLAEAACGSGTTLVIDGLDGLRDSQAQSAYRRLIALAIRCGVRVIASIRSFDLQHAYDLQEIFPPLAEHIVSARFLIDEFKEIGHIAVPELDDAEFGQVIAQLPIVQMVLDGGPHLRSLVHNLFNLDLLCKLISDGGSATQFSSVSTQAELFERYWQKRVRSHQLRQEMTEALRRLIEKMVDQQTLQVAPDEWSTPVKDALFSADLVRHPSPIPGRLPEQELVEFNHHLLLDYAAELLFARPRKGRLAVELASPDTWGLFLRPSLVLFHRYSWKHGRLDFWGTLISLERFPVPILQKLPGYVVVADEALSREDLQHMLEGSLRGDTDSKHWIKITQAVIATAAFSSLPKLFSTASGDWWIEFAHDLISTAKPELVYSGRRLLFSAYDTFENLSSQAHLLLNQAAVMLVKFHWIEDTQPNPVIRPAIGWVCRTIGSSLSASSAIIRRILARDELQRAGYIQTYEIARFIEDVWQADPALAVEVYDGIFGYVEIDRSATPMGSGQILPLISNRRQDYEAAYYQLSEKFPEFLVAHPKEATRALIRVVRHFRNQKHPPREPPTIETFSWNDRECRLQSDYSHIWDRAPEFGDSQAEMLRSWEDYLVTLPTDSQADENWEMIANVVAAENELAAVWRRLLIAGSRLPAFYAQRLWTMLTPPILIGIDTHEAAEDCIEAFVPQLPDEAVQQIESSILGIESSHFASVSVDAIASYLPRVKARLLCCVPEDKRGTASREFLAGCDPELLQPRQRDSGITVSIETMTTERWLDEQEIDIAKPKHQELLKVSGFLEELSSSDVTDGNLTDVISDIRNVEQILARSHNDIDDRVASTIQHRLVRGLSQVACSQSKLDRQLIDDLFQHFRTVLAAAVEAPSQQHLEQFDHSQGWNSLDPRTNAAEGFVCLVARMEGLLDDHRNLLRRLADDPEPVLRYHLGRRIWFLLNKWPEFVWETLERWITELPKRPGTLGVLQGTLHGQWFWRLRNDDVARADRLLKNLLTAAHLRDSTKLRNACGSWLGALCFFKGESWACDALGSAVVNIMDSLDELEGAQRVAVNELLPRTQRDLVPIEQHRRAEAFLLRLLSAADHTLEANRAETNNLSLSDRPTEPPPRVQGLVRLFDRVATEFQFSAEEHVKRWMTAEQDEVDAQLTAWWRTAGPILDALLAMPHPAIMFQLIKGLDHLVRIDDQHSFYWLRRVTLASVPVGLANEQLAADHTIGILERTLAEHRTSLAEGQLRSDFVQILEAYLQVGWPRAMRLAFQLEGIFR